MKILRFYDRKHYPCTAQHEGQYTAMISVETGFWPFKTTKEAMIGRWEFSSMWRFLDTGEVCPKDVERLEDAYRIMKRVIEAA